ncbi:MAG: beta strand repeat-containing protein, partial [Candidatus Limnocylindria bacterium]
MLAIVVFALASGTPAPVRGAVYTWDGGGLTNLWSDPLNWSLDLVPSAADTAVFNGTSVKNATIAISTSVQGVAINAGYTGTITQGLGAALTVGSAAFSQAAGTFVGGTAAITVNGAFSLSGGSFTSTTATLTVTGAVTKSGGTFAHNGGTVAFSTSNVTIDVGGSETFNNVSFLSGTKTIAAGNTLVVTGTLDLVSGSLNTGTLAAQGDIFARIGFTGGGTATLLINGTAAQTFDGDHTSASGGLPNVVIAKPAGTLTLLDILRTGRNWTYLSGTLAPGTSTVVFTGSAAGVITGDHALNNVELRGGTITIASGTTLTATGSVTLFSGSLNTGTLAAQGDIFARIGFTGGGTATLRINGTGAQTFDGDHTSATGALPNVVIDKPAGTLTLLDILRTGRNWTYATGSLAPGTSSVVFNGNLTIGGDHALNNVELRSGNVTVTSGDTLTVGGLLTLTDGNLEGGTVDALGNISLAAAFDGETGTVRIAGTADQTLTGAANTTSSDMANIVIDKPSGTLFLVGTIRMLTSSWTWLQGAVDPGTSTVYFDTTVTISGTHSLYNVYLSGGGHTVTPGDTLTALGTLT